MVTNQPPVKSSSSGEEGLVPESAHWSKECVPGVWTEKMTLAHEVTASGGLRVLDGENSEHIRSPRISAAGPNNSSATHEGLNTSDNSASRAKQRKKKTRTTQARASNTSTNLASEKTILLATANSLLVADNSTIPVRLLIDPASELTFISNSIVKTCHLSRRPTSTSILGIGNSPAMSTKGVTIISLRSIYTSEQVTLYAHILQTVTGKLPTFSTQPLTWTTLKRLHLADPDYSLSRPIDILIGADNYGKIIKQGLKKSSKSSLIAQNSIFGWMITGPVAEETRTIHRAFHCAADESYEELKDLLVKFWVQEEIPNSADGQLSSDEQTCEDHYVATHSRDHDGRYIVRIPLTSSPKLLGDSSIKAQQCLKSMLRRLTLDKSYSELYHTFMREYEQLNHMTRAPAATANSPVYYLPHHGVLREDSVTTKLRVVFNGSSPSTSGISVNDIQHVGANLQRDIADVLLWIRKHKFVFTTDITKMYRQLKVHPDDWDLQRIFWIDSQLNIIPYQLTTVTYGTRSAPFLAIRTMIQLVKDEGHKFPLAVEPVMKGRYVDDIFGGADTVEQLSVISQQVRQLCMAGGFPLAKWHSNSLQFLTTLTDNSTQDKIHEFESTSTKLLGLSWIPRTDSFKFTSKLNNDDSQITKRRILSQTAQLYDPLGFLAPFIIKAKSLLQELWVDQLTWDEPVPAHIETKWREIRNELKQVSDISIPRWLTLTDKSIVELHGFSDASTTAMAAVVYMRSNLPGHTPTTTIICSKTKVAPTKKMSIPRLELTAALMLAKLVNHVKEKLEIQPTRINCWTDSSVTLTWIQSIPSRWKEFVSNRVSAIQHLTPISVWRHIPGKQNPADCASRGITISQLQKHPLWWTGPQWLSADDSKWPNQPPAYDSSAQQEEQPGKTFCIRKTQLRHHWEMIYRYSRLIKLLRVTAICFRVIQIIKRVPQSTLQYPLTPQEIERAKIFWIQATQELYFSHELKMINSNSLPVSHPFARLTPIIDTQGILRVGGRLSNANLSDESKHPAILPQRAYLSRLIIADAHEKTLHGGTQATLSLIRSSYWIIGGRLPVRSHIFHCMKCARLRGKRAQQLMGQLPVSRVKPARPFAVCGVDYAGPITLKTWKGRGAKKTKGWICIFVCFVTSAVHIEVVGDYTSESFVAAFRRFTGRRGVCRQLHSDCGTTFKGAETEIRQLFQQGTQQFTHLAATLANDGVEWRFNPPAAPHMGGKWEAAVKSVKHHLNRTLGDMLVTYEELTTLLVQIEAVLNSRPLLPLSDDSTDTAALTPGHFLTGEPLVTLPEPPLQDLPVNRLDRWQFIQQRLQHFWSTWSKDYLQQQLAISKWKKPSYEIQEGSLVLICGENMPPSKWPLARVIKLHPGKDNLTRVVDLKTATTELTRPITKLAILPCEPTGESTDQQPESPDESTLQQPDSTHNSSTQQPESADNSTNQQHQVADGGENVMS